jgi:tight adherence protein C
MFDFDAGTLLILVGGAAAIMIILVMILGGWRRSVPERLADLSAAGAGGSGETSLDRLSRRRLAQEENRQKLRERLMQAGFYGAVSGSMFLVVRGLMIAGAGGLGFLIAHFGGQFTLNQGLLAGTACGIAATVAPGIWLDRLKGRRQTTIRRALPDALDVLVVCLQGGLSVMASMSRVARELAVAHPLLAVEIKIAERQMQMGRSAAEAIRGIADRFDLEELRGMASVVKQAERVGSSVATALEVFAETLRLKRQQQAEELAAKAAVKMLFPTLLCIFPAIFVVILGPAAIQIYEKLVVGQA